MPSERIKRYMDRNKKLRERKTFWNTHWQLLGEYILTRRQDFIGEPSPGEFLDEKIFDSSGPKANQIMASSLLGSLWPDGARSFKLTRPDGIPDTRDNKEYYDFVKKKLAKVMDNPKAGLVTALEEYMLHQGAFGTSGIALLKGDKSKGQPPIIYRAKDIKTMSIAQGPNGFVDTVYDEQEWSVLEHVKEYGLDNVSAKVRKQYEDGDFEAKVKFLHIVEPRLDRDPNKLGNKNMPFLSLHIELPDGKILRESGFEDMRILVARFIKNIGEEYGRSAGMQALPDILNINIVKEAIIVATEKNLDPPLTVIDDGSTLSGGVINTSAGAVNVFRVKGRLGNHRPVEPLLTVGEMQSAKDLIEDLKESISQHFFIDRLLDFNNETKMTLGEANLRNKLRSATLGSLFSRQTAEMFDRLIETGINMLFADNELGVIAGSAEEAEMIANGKEPRIIPDDIARAMLAGEDFYEIEYITPAARMMKAEQLEGIVNTWEFAGDNQEMVDNLDAEKSIQLVSEITGAPPEILRSSEAVKAIRDARSAVVGQQSQLDQISQGADAAQKLARASKDGQSVARSA